MWGEDRMMMNLCAYIDIAAALKLQKCCKRALSVLSSLVQRAFPIGLPGYLNIQSVSDSVASPRARSLDCCETQLSWRRLTGTMQTQRVWDGALEAWSLLHSTGIGPFHKAEALFLVCLRGSPLQRSGPCSARIIPSAHARTIPVPRYTDHHSCRQPRTKVPFRA